MMDKALTKELMKADLTRSKCKIAEKFGRAMKWFGLHGVLCVNVHNDGVVFRFLLNAAFRGFGFLFFYRLFQDLWIPALLVYIAIHALPFFLGRSMERKNMEKMRQMGEYFNEKCAQYYADECRKRNIVGDAVLIENVMIRSESIEAYLKPTKAEFELYCLESVDGDVGRFDRRLDPQPDDVDMAKHITSVEFNKKYGIFVKKGMERSCVDLFRPTVQVAMCDKFRYEHLAMVKVGNDRLTASHKTKVKPTTTTINIYGDDALLFIFDDIDRFCEQMEKMGNKYYPEVEHLINGMGLKP